MCFSIQVILPAPHRLAVVQDKKVSRHGSQNLPEQAVGVSAEAAGTTWVSDFIQLQENIFEELSWMLFNDTWFY